MKIIILVVALMVAMLQARGLDSDISDNNTIAMVEKYRKVNGQPNPLYNIRVLPAILEAYSNGGNIITNREIFSVTKDTCGLIRNADNQDACYNATTDMDAVNEVIYGIYIPIGLIGAKADFYTVKYTIPDDNLGSGVSSSASVVSKLTAKQASDAITALIAYKPTLIKDKLYNEVIFNKAVDKLKEVINLEDAIYGKVSKSKKSNVCMGGFNNAHGDTRWALMAMQKCVRRVKESDKPLTKVDVKRIKESPILSFVDKERYYYNAGHYHWLPKSKDDLYKKVNINSQEGKAVVKAFNTVMKNVVGRGMDSDRLDGMAKMLNACHLYAGVSCVPYILKTTVSPRYKEDIEKAFDMSTIY